jgi:hypothetical protein
VCKWDNSSNEESFNLKRSDRKNKTVKQDNFMTENKSMLIAKHKTTLSTGIHPLHAHSIDRWWNRKTVGSPASPIHM